VFFGELKGGDTSKKHSLVIAHIPKGNAGRDVYFAYYALSKNEDDAFMFWATKTDRGTYRVEHRNVTMEFTVDGKSLYGTLTDTNSKVNYSFWLTLYGKGKDAVTKATGDAFLLMAHGAVSGWVNPDSVKSIIGSAGFKDLP